MKNTALSPPPQPREATVDWRAAEAAMRAPLPDDYKSFIERYGSGKICNFLTVLNPSSENRHINLVEKNTALLSALGEYREQSAKLGKKMPLAIWPEPGGLIAWGTTDNGDACYWRSGLSDPNTWRVVINDGRGSMWEEFNGTMTAFLAALLSRRYVSEILTDEEFPPEEVFFQTT